MVHMTEFKFDDLNPEFSEFRLPSGLVCDNNPNWPLRLEVWDYSENKKDPHTFVASQFFTIAMLESGTKII